MFAKALDWDDAKAGVATGLTKKGCWPKHWLPEDWGTKKGWKLV